MNPRALIKANQIEITPAIQSLLDTIRNEIGQGKERAYLAMEQEKKITYWHVGKHIKSHLLQNQNRAEYGPKLITILAEAMGLGKTILYNAIQFYEEYPDIFHSSGKLTWSHIRILLTIPEKPVRQRYEEKIITENLSVGQLKDLIWHDKGLPIPKSESDANLIPLERGKPFTYRLKVVQGVLMLDLGFHFFIKSPIKNRLQEKVVQVEKKKQRYKFIAAEHDAVPHYFYKAYLIEIIDGDTLWVDIDLGFDAWTTQKLRLRGINSEGIETPGGKTAKDYIAARLKGCKFIAVKTYWRDKFNRFLADIFYDKKEADYHRLTQNGSYLNQELLNKNLAVRYYD